MTLEVFWDSFGILELRRHNVLVEGDMNFILRQGEVWGDTGFNGYPLAYFLLQKIDDVGLFDIKH
jgi:hypothetical protein